MARAKKSAAKKSAKAAPSKAKAVQQIDQDELKDSNNNNNPPKTNENEVRTIFNFKIILHHECSHQLKENLTSQYRKTLEDIS